MLRAAATEETVVDNVEESEVQESDGLRMELFLSSYFHTCVASSPW